MALEEKKEAYIIVSEIFNIISTHIEVESVEVSKKIATTVVDRVVKSHEEWSTEQDEYYDYYQQVKAEISRI